VSLGSMRRTSLPAALSALVLVAGCEPGAVETNEPPAPITHEFPAIEVAAHEERYSDCQSWTLDNDEPLYVNTVEMSAGPAWHHANWMFVPEDQYDGPDGTWNCNSRDYEEVEAGLSGGVLFAQSTQSTGETQQFPAGEALLIPARSRVVADVHLVNAGESPLSTAITLTLFPLREDDVLTRLRPFVTSYFPLDLPPQQHSVFSATCDVAGPNSDEALDFGIHYVLPHYHGFGTGFFLKASAPSGEIVVYDEENTVGGGEGWGRMLDPPVDLTGVTSIEFGCRYHNTGDTPISWGNYDGEMCMMLGYSNDNRRWVGGVLNGPNMVVGTDGTGAVLNTAACTMARL
jgi:hypothetical protein